MGNTLFTAIRNFIVDFINKLPIGPDQVQVAVAQYTSDVRIELDLNSHATKELAAAAVKKLKIKGGSQVANTGAALDFVRTNMFIPSKGSRIQQNVPQLMILFTARKSSDSIIQPAEEMKRSGILTLAAGARNADIKELSQIAFDEKLAFMVKDFRGLFKTPQTIIAPLTTLSGVIITEEPTEGTVQFLCTYVLPLFKVRDYGLNSIHFLFWGSVLRIEHSFFEQHIIRCSDLRVKHDNARFLPPKNITVCIVFKESYKGVLFY